jgi:hypothetical protein
LYDGRCYEHCPAGTYPSEVFDRRTRKRNLTEAGLVVMKRQGSDEPKPTAIEAADMEPESLPGSPYICLQCHYTCATCSGPLNSQCSSCLNDATLVNLTDIEVKFFCYPKTLLPQIESANWHYRLNVALSIVLFVVSFISLYFLLACILKRCSNFCCGGNYNSNINIAYNKLAVDDKHQSAVEVEDEIKKALHDSSDSDSEDDLNL